MSGIYGADVAQLRQLAQQFSAQADRIDHDRMSVGNAIQIRAWAGPVAVAFRHRWESEHSRKLAAAASRLRSAAADLKRNADDQERASAVGGGSSHATPSGGSNSETDLDQFFESIKLAGLFDGTLHDMDDLFAALRSGKLEYKAFSEWSQNVKGLDASTILSLAGMAISAKELGEAIGTDDPAATLSASLDLIAGAAGTKVPLVGLAYEIGKFLGETGYHSLQAVYDSPSSALDFAARQMFGDSATFDGLEQYQRDALMTRYDGLGGLLVNNVDHIGGAFSDLVTWLSTGSARGAR